MTPPLANVSSSSPRRRSRMRPVLAALAPQPNCSRGKTGPPLPAPDSYPNLTLSLPHRCPVSALHTPCCTAPCASALVCVRATLGPVPLFCSHARITSAPAVRTRVPSPWDPVAFGPSSVCPSHASSLDHRVLPAYVGVNWEVSRIDTTRCTPGALEMTCGNVFACWN